MSYQVMRLRGDGGLEIDAMSLFLGALLGSGIDRETYVFRPDPTKVVKIEVGNGRFQNVKEYQTWMATFREDHPLQQSLAEVYDISTYGCWLLMERTTPPGPDYEWPSTMPVGLTDFKKDNYGLTKDGRLVCHDYGTNILTEYGMSKRMRKVEWWS